MSELGALLTEPFLRRALAAGLLASLLAGSLGTFVVLRRLTFLSGGISHAAFGGIGLCHLLGLPPQLGALAVAGISALALGPLPRRTARSLDALIGVLWAVGMAAGVFFIHLTPGYAPDLGAYLFGNLLLVRPQDLWLLALFAVATWALMLLYFKELVAFAFDETYAAVQGVPVRLFSTALLLMVGVAVVLLLPIVGLLLVLALLTIPSLIALRWSESLGRVLIISTGCAAAMTLGGLLLAYLWDVPAGPVIILLGGALLALAHVAKALLSHLSHRR